MRASSSGAAPRLAAARCVAAVIGGQTLEQGLAAVQADVSPRDQALLRELCFGTLRGFPRLDALLKCMLRQPLRRRDVELRALALVGLYQLSAMRVPEHAAVSATVEAAGSLRQRAGRGLVNALLRRYQREQEALLSALPPAASAALPPWLWDAFAEQWPQQLGQLVDAGNAHPPMTLRVNRLRGDRDDYLSLLQQFDTEALAGRLSDVAVTLRRPADVGQIPGFADGRVSVQDEAAQLAALLLDPRPGERILDACAAPGGKTGHLLECLGGRGELYAADVNPERLARVIENLQRLGLGATTLCADVSAPSQQLTGAAPFDAILLDVPCSATGVIRRHPDIKLLRRPGDIAGFAARQSALLASCWSLLGAGGRLLYVTCSVLRQENQDVVEAFLSSRGDAREGLLTPPGARRCNPGWQLLPEVDGGDGLFYALLEKSGAARA